MLAFGFGGWAVYTHIARPNVVYLLLGLASGAVGVGLIVYGVKVLHKLREI